MAPIEVTGWGVEGQAQDEGMAPEAAPQTLGVTYAGGQLSEHMLDGGTAREITQELVEHGHTDITHLAEDLGFGRAGEARLVLEPDGIKLLFVRKRVLYEDIGGSCYNNAVKELEEELERELTREDLIEYHDTIMDYVSLCLKHEEQKHLEEYGSFQKPVHMDIDVNGLRFKTAMKSWIDEGPEDFDVIDEIEVKIPEALTGKFRQMVENRDVEGLSPLINQLLQIAALAYQSASAIENG